MSEDDVDKILGRSREKRLKDEDLFETVEEVFDTSTVMTILQLMRRKIIKKMSGVISSGKEARVYLARGFERDYLAVKIYLTSTAEFKKSIYKYIMGDPRFEGLKVSDTRDLIFAWARKEFSNLSRMWKAGVRVPEPITFLNNVVVMEFLGVNGVRYPLLVESYKDLETEDLEKIWSLVEGELNKIVCESGLVHGDLSEYNIMVVPDAEAVYIIDVSQAVDVKHPNAREFLERDIRNITRFFSEEAGIRVSSYDELFSRVEPCLEKKKRT